MRDSRRVEATIRGDLASASVIELGQFMLLGRKTGALHVIHQKERGTLYFLDGNIVAAVAPDLRGGESAAIEVLGWEDGNFHFVPEPVGDSKEITSGTQNLLLETARQMDEAGLVDSVTANLQQVDELGELFAEITGDRGESRPSSESPDLSWLVESAGRQVVQFGDQPAVRCHADGQWSSEDTPVRVDPARLLPAGFSSGPFEGWVRVDEMRLYLTWGLDGYRLVHPFPAPTPTDHLERADALERVTGSQAPVAIYGNRRSGKSLLAALSCLDLAERAGLTVAVTGVPTHDLQNGYRVLHEVVGADQSFDSAASLVRRWRPNAVVIDVDPSPAAIEFIAHCRSSVSRVVVTVSASDGQQARERVRAVIGSVSGWQIASPWPTGPGPRLDVSLEAA